MLCQAINCQVQATRQPLPAAAAQPMKSSASQARSRSQGRAVPVAATVSWNRPPVHGLHLGLQAQKGVSPRQLSSSPHTQRTPQSGRAVSLFPQGAWAMSAQATLRRQYPGVEEVASEPVLPRHHPPRAVGPLDWAEVDSSQGDVPRCHAFKLDPPQKAGKARPAGEARGKDLRWCSD